MKKFLINITVFFVAVVVVDIIFGYCCDYMCEQSKSGDQRKVNYAVRECTADMLIMGSSRANHHYNPQILSDSLGVTVYNLGIDGSGVILMGGFYKLMVKRYIPKYIIYELTPSFDFNKYAGDANNTRYLSQLKPYYREEALAQMFDDIDVLERLKLKSGLYRYNTSCLNLFRSYVSAEDRVGDDGYRSLQGVMKDYKPFKIDVEDLDSLKVKYLRQLIYDCKSNGTKLFFVVSPRFGATTSIEYMPGFEICKQNGCEILDYYSDQRFVTKKEYFKDSYHMNEEGANAFTRQISIDIKHLIQKQKKTAKNV